MLADSPSKAGIYHVRCSHERADGLRRLGQGSCDSRSQRFCRERMKPGAGRVVTGSAVTVPSARARVSPRGGGSSLLCRRTSDHAAQHSLWRSESGRDVLARSVVEERRWRPAGEYSIKPSRAPEVGNKPGMARVVRRRTRASAPRRRAVTRIAG